jgi:hypothetical protein
VQSDPATAACVTVNVRPATVSVPVREAPVFAPTVNATDPLPVPLPDEVMVIHGALLAAVHAQPDCVWMSMAVPGPPVAGMFSLEGEIEYEQVVGEAGVAACTIIAR